MIAAVGCHHIIIRTAWLYSEFGKNFVKTMIGLTATKSELKVVFDQVGTPTYAYDLATAIAHIIENRSYEGNDGIYHFPMKVSAPGMIYQDDSRICWKCSL